MTEVQKARENGYEWRIEVAQKNSLPPHQTQGPELDRNYSKPAHHPLQLPPNLSVTLCLVVLPRDCNNANSLVRHGPVTLAVLTSDIATI